MKANHVSRLAGYALAVCFTPNITAFQCSPGGPSLAARFEAYSEVLTARVVRAQPVDRDAQNGEFVEHRITMNVTRVFKGKPPAQVVAAAFEYLHAPDHTTPEYGRDGTPIFKMNEQYVVFRHPEVPHFLDYPDPPHTPKVSFKTYTSPHFGECSNTIAGTHDYVIEELVKLQDGIKPVKE